MGFLESFEEDPTKLLHIMLRKGINLIPLKTLEKSFGIDWLFVQLQFHEYFLQLVCNRVDCLDLFLVMAESGSTYTYE